MNDSRAVYNLHVVKNKKFIKLISLTYKVGVKMIFKKTLESILFAGIIGFSGCNYDLKPAPSEYVEGEVTKIYGTLPNIVKSQNHIYALFGGGKVDTVKFGDLTYGIQVNTPKGVYTIDLNDYAGSEGPKTLLNVSQVIKQGTRVRFPTKDVPQVLNGTPTGFSAERLGVLDPDDLEILSGN